MNQEIGLMIASVAFVFGWGFCLVHKGHRENHVVWIYHPVDKGPWLKTGTHAEATDCEMLCINKGHFIEVARYLNGGKM